VSAFFDDLSEHLATSARQVDVQTRLINDLLDVSRMTANTLKLEMQRCDLVRIVRETVEDLRVTAPERSLLLEVPEQTTAYVLADRDRISQVVSNYVTNALRYSSPCRPVHIGLTTEEDMARVWVRDQGPGLSAEAQKNLWQRYHQVKEVPVLSGSGKGLGLGLYICQMLIAQHQGEVGVESTPGEGSTFWFTLPLVT
jgi:signal transduction histidine kinase